MAVLQPTPNMVTLTATSLSMILAKLAGTAYLRLLYMALPGLDSAGPSGSKVAVHLHVSPLGAGWAPPLGILCHKVLRPFSMVVQGCTGTKEDAFGRPRTGTGTVSLLLHWPKPI